MRCVNISDTALPNHNLKLVNCHRLKAVAFPFRTSIIHLTPKGMSVLPET